MTTEKEIREFYAKKIEDAETAFEKNVIRAEMEHKVKTAQLGYTDEELKAMRDASDYECEGCGA